MNFKLPSVISLILVNLIPIYGVAVLGWDVSQVLMLYWAESGVIGFYTILKLFISSPIWWIGILLCLFFVIHFGGFMLGHLIFLIVFFPPSGGGDISLLSVQSVLLTLKSIAVPLALMLISHGISFRQNFLMQGKGFLDLFKTLNLMFDVYDRIFIMHLTIVGAGYLVLELGQPKLAIVLLVILKIIVDLFSHLKKNRLRNSFLSIN